MMTGVISAGAFIAFMGSPSSGHKVAAEATITGCG
jgi:hypothetical protein